jgi:hypothetical protein
MPTVAFEGVYEALEAPAIKLPPDVEAVVFEYH